MTSDMPIPALLTALPVPMHDACGRAAPFGKDIPSPANPPAGCKFQMRGPYATGICKTVHPVPETGGAHQIACHHWQDLPSLGADAVATAPRSAATGACFALCRAAAARTAVQ